MKQYCYLFAEEALVKKASTSQEAVTDALPDSYLYEAPSGSWFFFSPTTKYWKLIPVEEVPSLYKAMILVQ